MGICGSPSVNGFAAFRAERLCLSESFFTDEALPLFVPLEFINIH
jgi:hypothetical protein